MVDTPLASFVIYIKVLEIVVKVDTARAEVSTEQRSVGSENRRHVDVPFAAEGDGQTSLPFVEMGNDGGIGLSGGELATLAHATSQVRSRWRTSPRNHATM